MSLVINMSHDRRMLSSATALVTQVFLRRYERELFSSFVVMIFQIVRRAQIFVPYRINLSMDKYTAMKSKVLFKLKSLFIKIEIQESRFLKCIPTIHISSLIPKQVSFNLLLKLVDGDQIICVLF